MREEMTNFGNCYLQVMLELTNQLVTKKSLLALTRIFLLEYLLTKWKSRKYVINADNSFKFSSTLTRSKENRKQENWIVAEERYIVGVGRMWHFSYAIL